MAEGTCTVEACEKPSYSRDMCLAHYWRVLKYGSPHIVLKRGPKPKPEGERFWAKVEQVGECWIWMGSRTANGYGSCHGEERLAHRWAYKDMIGPIPDGLHLDHLCRVRACVNPYHLEPVPQSVNNQRMDSTAFLEAAGEARQRVNSARRAAALAASHCRHGHLLDEANTRWDKKGTRLCKTCQRESTRRYLLRRQAREMS